MSGFGLENNRFNRFVEQLELILNADIDDDGHVGSEKNSSTKVLSKHRSTSGGGNQQQQQQFSAAMVVPMPPPSQLKGRNIKALFIGVNYIGTKAELKGCINDVSLLQNFLLMKARFPATETRVLAESDQGIAGGADASPTKQNILDSLKWLVADSKKGDVYFLHFSGHGTSVKDVSGDEADGLDEAMVPLDYTTNGLIIDDEIYSIVVGGMHKESKLTAVIDCCHSGTLLDLPYSFVATEANAQKVKTESNDGSFFGKMADKFFRRKTEADVVTLPDVTMFSGCKDDQTSADVADTTQTFESENGNNGSAGNAGGACSNALVEILLQQKDQRITSAKLVTEMQTNLKTRGFTQVPQLSSSRPLDANANFSFF